MWNANNSNFYAQIMDSLSAFFGLKAEDTTEAELHQKLTEAKTQVELAEAAKTEGLAAAAKEVEGLKADVARLAAELTAATETATTATAEVETLKASAVKLESDLTAANTALATKVKEANTLAGEVARLTAGAKPKGVEAVDTDEQLSKVPAGNGQTVKVKAFDDILN
jgi:chromosome segregation ATPase